MFAGTRIGAMVGVMPWGALSDRVGERIVFTIGLTLCAMAIALTAFVSSFALLLVGCCLRRLRWLQHPRRRRQGDHGLVRDRRARHGDRRSPDGAAFRRRARVAIAPADRKRQRGPRSAARGGWARVYGGRHGRPVPPRRAGQAGIGGRVGQQPHEGQPSLATGLRVLSAWRSAWRSRWASSCSSFTTSVASRSRQLQPRLPSSSSSARARGLPPGGDRTGPACAIPPLRVTAAAIGCSVRLDRGPDQRAGRPSLPGPARDGRDRDLLERACRSPPPLSLAGMTVWAPRPASSSPASPWELSLHRSPSERLWRRPAGRLGFAAVAVASAAGSVGLENPGR